MQKQEDAWIEMLKDSSWFTIAWEWFQTLLGRICDFVLWVTMIFACYQLIPGAPLPPQQLSITMFVLQFVALDIGGLSLLQIARRRGLDRYGYVSWIAYILIGITLVTIAYAGIQHAIPGLSAQAVAEQAKPDAHGVKTDPGLGVQITIWVEVVLVVARSIMTVLYGQAIYSLKSEEKIEGDRVQELEQELSVKSTELDTLTAQFNTQLNALTAQLNAKSTELDTLRVKVNTLTTQLDALTQEKETLSVKLDGKEAQLAEIRDNRESSVKEHRKQAELVVSTTKAQLTDADKTIKTLRTQLLNEQAILHTEQQKALTLTAQLNTKSTELDTLTAQFNAQFNALTSQLNTKNAELDTLRVKVNTLTTQLDIKKTKPNAASGNANQGKIVHLDQTQDSTYESRIRALLMSEPSLSGREIARRIGCSIPTACNWKRVIETESTNAEARLS